MTILSDSREEVHEFRIQSERNDFNDNQPGNESPLNLETIKPIFP
jgi:hypothetical protein